MERGYKHYLRGFWHLLKRVWHFLWEEDSLLSWIVNIILAFILIKFIVYPGLGLALSTSHPIVAVISESMEHDGTFDGWWYTQMGWYGQNNISRQDFQGYPFKNGFNKGDIMVLKGIDPGRLKIGDVIVYQSYIRTEPIIHRIVKIDRAGGNYLYTTKGDHNNISYDFEKGIDSSKVIGKAVLKIPLLGYIKIWFVQLLGLFNINLG